MDDKKFEYYKTICELEANIRDEQHWINEGYKEIKHIQDVIDVKLDTIKEFQKMLDKLMIKDVRKEKIKKINE